MSPVTIEIPLGLGDAVYCYPILKELAQTRFEGRPIYIARNPYRSLFEPLKNFGNFVDTLTPNAPVLKIHYRQRRDKATTQYEDLCIAAGLRKAPEFVFDWPYEFNPDFAKQLMTQLGGVGYIVVKEPCAAHMHKKNMQPSIEPRPDEMDEMLAGFRGAGYKIISVGQEERFKHRLKNIDIDLDDKTSLTDYITLVKFASCVITQPGHLVPLAQAFHRPFKVFYQESGFPHIRPEKLNELFSNSK